MNLYFNSIARTMVRNHERSQWYDIVHFEHKLSWFCFWFPERPPTNGDVFLTYKLMIVPLINQCGTPSQQSSTTITPWTIRIKGH